MSSVYSSPKAFILIRELKLRASSFCAMFQTIDTVNVLSKISEGLYINTYMCYCTPFVFKNM